MMEAIRLRVYLGVAEEVPVKGLGKSNHGCLALEAHVAAPVLVPPKSGERNERQPFYHLHCFFCFHFLLPFFESMAYVGSPTMK